MKYNYCHVLMILNLIHIQGLFLNEVKLTEQETHTYLMPVKHLYK